MNWTHSWENGFYALVCSEHQTLNSHSFPSPKMKHVPSCVFDLFLYKKGTIYITFIKSFSIIKYNITLLQKFQIPATIQDKLPIRVHKVSFFHFNFFFLNNVQSFMCQQFWQDKTKLFTVTNQVVFSIHVPTSAKKAKTSTRRGTGVGGVWRKRRRRGEIILVTIISFFLPLSGI